MATGPMGDDANDLLREILEALREANRGTASRPGPGPGDVPGPGMGSAASDGYRNAQREAFEQFQESRAGMSPRERRMAGSWATFRKTYQGPHGPEEAWFRVHDPDARGGSQGAMAAGNTVGDMAKTVGLSMPGPVAQGFAYAIAKTQGWRDLDNAFQNLARKAKDSGGSGLLFDLGSGGLRAGGVPLFMAAAVLGSLKGLESLGSQSFRSQAERYAPLNPMMAQATMAMTVADLRRDLETGRRTQGTFRELGDALNVFKNEMVPLNSALGNLGNALRAFGLGAGSQVVREGREAAADLGAFLRPAGAGLVGWARGLDAGQVAGALGFAANMNPLAMAGDPQGWLVNQWQNFQQVASPWRAEAFEAAAGVLNDAGQGAAAAGWGWAGDLLKNWGDVARGAAEVERERFGGAGKTLGDISDFVGEMTRDKPPDVVAAGMTSGFREMFANPDRPVEAFKEGFQKGVFEQEGARQEGEARSRAMMQGWVDRLAAIANGDLMNRPRLRARVGGGRSAFGFVPGPAMRPRPENPFPDRGVPVAGPPNAALGQGQPRAFHPPDAGVHQGPNARPFGAHGRIPRGPANQHHVEVGPQGQIRRFDARGRRIGHDGRPRGNWAGNQFQGELGLAQQREFDAAERRAGR